MNWKELPLLRRLSTKLLRNVDSQVKRDFAKKFGRLRVATTGPEIYVVSADDQFVGKEILRRGHFEFDKFENCISILGPKFNRKLLIDVGANIGTTCIPAISRGYFERAIAFEPEPLNHSILLANIALNRLSERIEVKALAIGAERDQQLSFELSPINSGDHRVRVTENDGMENEAARKTIAVQSTTLDVACGEVDPKSTLLWVDTQGYEGAVFKGAKKAMACQTPIAFEFWPYGLNRTNGYADLKKCVENADYNNMADLRKPDTRIAPSSVNLDLIFNELSQQNIHTDLIIW